MEQYSLLAKIRISKENFKQFLKEKPTVPSIKDGWENWWGNAEMYDKEDFREKNLHSYEAKSNKEIIDYWIKQSEIFPFSDYDEKNEIWHFGMLLFSGNYEEFIPMLAFIRSVEIFKENDNKDFIVIYDYYWSYDNAYHFMAFLKFQKQKSIFFLEPDDKSLRYATKYLDAISEKMQKENEEPELPNEENVQEDGDVDAIFHRMATLPFVLFQGNRSKNIPKLPVFENDRVKNFAQMFQNLCNEGLIATKDGDGAKIVDALTAIQSFVKSNDSLKIEIQINDTLKLENWLENFK